ncbi:anti-sigma regulatory factor (Ser/Thr protein kinase) [Actinoplanes lutulentus]|nr:ATP-binding protein [Actinoplanes lutulentus]MBB2948707.1 anti-sigma regulatory factor (Ser/Thr protein kinase) [Actinoplanes lutulentus]
MSEATMSETDGDGDGMSYSVPDDLRAVRVFVTERALALGMPENRIDLLTLAVSELTTNTLQHTSGGGHIRIWAENGRLVCDVVDRGAERPFGRAMPAAEAVRGRGLAIVERVCDEVYTTAVPEGTLVRICLDL